MGLGELGDLEIWGLGYGVWGVWGTWRFGTWTWKRELGHERLDMEDWGMRSWIWEVGIYGQLCGRLGYGDLDMGIWLGLRHGDLDMGIWGAWGTWGWGHENLGTWELGDLNMGLAGGA